MEKSENNNINVCKDFEFFSMKNQIEAMKNKEKL